MSNEVIHDNDVILELDQVTVKAKDQITTLLNNICLKISYGETIGIIGNSGAGKSTLLKLLNHLYSADQGEYLLQGQKIEDINPSEIRRRISLVPQEPNLLGMDVKSTLIYPLYLRDFSKQKINHRLQTVIEQFSIPQSWLNKRDFELSLGQKQLVTIARGMIVNPMVLLLDEPTSALDMGKSNWLRERLQNLCQEQKMSIVVVNHNLEWIKKFAQRLIWLDKSQIREDLTISEVNWTIIENNFLMSNNNQDDFDDF